MQLSVQERFAPDDVCFGCGQANLDGLRLRSFPEGEQLVASWTPAVRHQAFPGILNGGIIGTLLDCHCNWTAAWRLAERDGQPAPPCTVTAEYTIRLLAPTPVNELIQLRAWLVRASGRRAEVHGELGHNGQVTATCSGLFVAVKPDHPAFVQRHRPIASSD